MEYAKYENVMEMNRVLRDYQDLKDGIEYQNNEYIFNSFKRDRNALIFAYSAIYRISKIEALHQIKEKLRKHVHKHVSHSYNDLSWNEWVKLDWHCDFQDNEVAQTNYYMRDFLEFPKKQPIIEDITERFERDFEDDDIFI